MKKIFLFCFATSFCTGLQSQGYYQYYLDLNNVTDDKLTVRLDPPELSGGEVLFRMPKVVPGTYHIYDFGRFISDFTVTSVDGSAMKVEQTDKNTWKISNPANIKEISYKVEDSFDSEAEGPHIFEPAGTNIEAGKNILMNNHGFFGYFEGMSELPFNLDITKPEGFHGATALSYTSAGNIDQYRIPNYFRLVDNPILYAVPDTVVVNVGNAKVLIAVYNESKTVTADFIADNVKPTLEAQQQYLDGTLPVDLYAFLYYFTDKASLSGGALEHNNSSVYYFSSQGISFATQLIKDVAAHEFFHIVTPLTLHSEEIRYFDFSNPEMSEHLWLYEGCTEYFAHHAQLKTGLITQQAFVEEMSSKITAASGYNDTLPFTVMSKGCLDIYSNQYGNVYQKGALIGMCLDILLRKYSDGQKGLMDLLQELSAIYGKDKPFKDDELFNEIERLSYPEIGTFLRTYVSGNDPLPLSNLFALVGVAPGAGKSQMLPDLGMNLLLLGTDTTQKYLAIPSDATVSERGKTMGLKKGDVLLEINGVDISLEKAQEGFFKALATIKPGGEFEWLIGRPKRNGKLKKVKIKGTFAMGNFTTGAGGWELSATPTEEQLKLRNYWLAY